MSKKYLMYVLAREAKGAVWAGIRNTKVNAKSPF